MVLLFVAAAAAAAAAAATATLLRAQGTLSDNSGGIPAPGGILVMEGATRLVVLAEGAAVTTIAVVTAAATVESRVHGEARRINDIFVQGKVLCGKYART